MSVTGSEFFETYKLYRNFIGFNKDHPYSYKQWMRLDPSYKCAALYCQFYPEITLAWYKVATPWNAEVEGVEEIHKYLLKNVKKIEDDEKRFSPKYIYRVAWNCFDCLIPKWVPKLQWRIDNEVSPECQNSDGESYSVFDYTYDQSDSDFDEKINSKKRSSVLNSLDDATKCYIDFILGSISEYTFLCNMKRFGVIKSSIRDKSNRPNIIKELDVKYRNFLKSFIFEHLDDCDFVSCLDSINDTDKHILESSVSELAYEALKGSYGSTLEDISKNLDFRFNEVYDLLKALAKLLYSDESLDC